MSRETKLTRMPDFSKRKSSNGMINKRILKREFHVGEKVLLYRSRLRFFAENYSQNGKDPMLLKRCTAQVR
jgi:hypothetical protein